MGRDDVTDLLIAELVGCLVRVAAEKPHQRVRRHRQQPDDRSHQHREPVEHGSDGIGELCVALDREALGNEFPEHEREVCDHQRQPDRRHGRRDRLRKTKTGKQLRHRGGDGCRAIRGRGEASDRHADLDRGEERVRVPCERGDLRAAAPACGDRVELALAQSYKRHLGRGEHAADEHEHHDQGDVPPQVGHQRVTPSRAVLFLPPRVTRAPGLSPSASVPDAFTSGPGRRCAPRRSRRLRHPHRPPSRR